MYQKPFSLLLIFLFFTCGCIRLGPDFKKPAPGFDTPASFQNVAASPEESLKIRDAWWNDFGNPEINSLVSEVLKSNHDINIASEVIREIQSYFKQTRADRYPSLSLSAQGQRQQVPDAMVMPGSSQINNSYNLSLPASFEIDLWGRLSRAEEAVKADLLYATENRDTVIHSVIAEAVTLYLQMESLERRIQVAKESIDNYKNNLETIESRYQRGLSSILDVKQARSSLAQAETGLPSLYRELGTTQQRICLISGRYPMTHTPGDQPEDYYNRLAPVKPGLHSDILMRRPDVRASEAKLMSLNAKIGVAKASRFPRISLTGNLGYSSTELSDLFQPESELWSIAAGLTQSVFNAGKLKSVQKAAEAKYRQGLIEYAKTILTAFFEVENALLSRKKLINSRDLAVIFLKEAREAQDVAENHYIRGLADYITLLQSQQTRFKAEESLIQADLAILTNRVTLYRALGGGFAGKKDN